MATIDSGSIINDLISKNGRDEDGGPAVIRIVQYVNAWGHTSYGVVFDGEDIERYNRATEYVRNPVTIWEPVR